jgi:hypothetical protein
MPYESLSTKEKDPKPLEKETSFETWLEKELPEQYKIQAQILNQLGFLEINRKTDEKCITGIDGKRYDFPKLSQIKEQILQNREIFEQKMKQGFTELQITPLLGIEKLHQTVKRELVKAKQAGKLQSAKDNPQDETEQTESLLEYLNEEDPCYIWEDISKGEQSGDLKYDVKEFSENHQGITKKEFLQKKQGYNILLLEKKSNIPSQGKNETVRGRKRPEANQTPKEYLEETKNREEYQNESGFTIEDEFIQLLSCLKRYGQVIDDYEGKGKVNYLTANYLESSGFVPSGCFSRGDRQFGLDRGDPEDRYPSGGCRRAVRFLKF